MVGGTENADWEGKWLRRARKIAGGMTEEGSESCGWERLGSQIAEIKTLWKRVVWGWGGGRQRDNKRGQERLWATSAFWAGGLFCCYILMDFGSFSFSLIALVASFRWERKKNRNSQFRRKETTHTQTNYQMPAQWCKHSPFPAGHSASWTRTDPAFLKKQAQCSRKREPNWKVWGRVKVRSQKPWSR